MKACISCGFSFASEKWNCPQCGWTPVNQEMFLSFIKERSMIFDSFNPKYYSSLYLLEKNNFWFNHRSKLIFKTINNFLPKIKNALEIGCGTGLVLSELGQKFSHLSLTGSDLFVEGLHLAKKRVPTATLYQIDACHMPFDREFDLILALDTIEHIEADSKALDEISRSLNPGGVLIVTVPQYRWLWSYQDEKAHHRRRYSKQELISKIEHSGLNIVRVTSFLTLLFPLMVLSRIYIGLITRQQRQYDSLRELKIPPIINRIMRAICMAEEYIFTIGINFPIGGSLLCIAEKRH